MVPGSYPIKTVSRPGAAGAFSMPAACSITTSIIDRKVRPRRCSSAFLRDAFCPDIGMAKKRATLLMPPLAVLAALQAI
jgi:hypothetical protein